MLRLGAFIVASLSSSLLVLSCGAGGSGSAPAEEEEPAGAAGSAPAEVTPARPPELEPPTQPSPVFTDAPEPTEERTPERCQKVDFLYVVDNSASMTDKQANLARSFAGFSRIVEDTLGTDDHQIMVIDTDGHNVGDTLYGGYEHDPCDGMLGAGLRKGAEGEACGVLGHNRFLRGDQGRAAEAFACLAHVGTLGDAIERPIDALLAATGAASSEAQSCNAGFLRDDAILVVTLITDEEDDRSWGEPSDWRRALLAVKGGDEDAIVMLGLLGDLNVPGGLPGGPCDGLSGAEAPRLQSFVDGFALGSLGSVCADDYSEFFAAAVDKIDTACKAFEPTVH